MEYRQREIQEEFNRLTHRLGVVFPNKLGLRNMQKYLRGLLGDSERKNGWQMSEYLGESTPYAIQQFIYRGRFNANFLRDELREYIIESIGEGHGVLVIDETGFLKQGKHSCGVKRQYSGTAGHRH